MNETETTKKTFKDMTPEEQTTYFRERARTVRSKNKKCAKCGAQATTKTVLTQEYLCDSCDKTRLVNKYAKKEPAK